MGQRIIHPCIFAKGDCGIGPYICDKTGCNCSCQFYCHNEHYWRPTYQIKCPNFSTVKVETKEEKKEKNKDNK